MRDKRISGSDNEHWWAVPSPPTSVLNGVILASVQEVPTLKIAELIQRAKCQSLVLLPPSVVSGVLQEVSGTIRVGVGSRFTLRGTYRDRYSTLDEFRNNRFGWRDFFAVLDEDGPPVGLFAVRGGGWSLIALTDESVGGVLAALVAPPQSFEWPKGAERT